MFLGWSCSLDAHGTDISSHPIAHWCHVPSDVVKDLRLGDKDKDKNLWSEDKDKDL